MIYNRSEILSLKMNAMTKLKRLSRNELFSRLQIIRFVDPLDDAAYKEVESYKHINQTDDAPHGDPWHVSFHASQFPGDDPMACPRQALYRMMDLPSASPFNRHARTVMAAGKAIEVERVQTWADAGLLLSAPPTDDVQTGFEDEEFWLTGSVDSVVLPRNWNKPLPIEIKSKYQDDIDQMKLGVRGPDDGHIRQIKVQIAMVRSAQETGEIWAELDPVTHGYIYYISRDRPSDTAEFRVDYDPRFYEVGLATLKKWKAMFLEDVLPELNPGKRGSKFGHPNGWKWSYDPCKFCDFKKTCQLDFREGVTALSESVGVERAKLVREQYDLEEARKRVVARWEKDRESA